HTPGAPTTAPDQPAAHTPTGPGATAPAGTATHRSAAATGDAHTPTAPAPHRTVAIIPARGGSKGIPLKNLQKVAGISLLARAITAAKSSPSIDRVIVSTDHEGIAAEALRTGAEVSHRPAEIAGDAATSESA